MSEVHPTPIYINAAYVVVFASKGEDIERETTCIHIFSPVCKQVNNVSTYFCHPYLLVSVMVLSFTNRLLIYPFCGIGKCGKEVKGSYGISGKMMDS